MVEIPALRFPPPLRPGARVLVTAPSSGVVARMWPRLEIVLAGLRARGLLVEEGRYLRSEHKAASAPAAERAAEFMAGLLRDDVDAVLPPWGGERAIELLERLDWAALRLARPKWFMGFSDLSTLMLPLRLLAGWASAHGANLMDLAPSQTDPLTRGAQTPLFAEAGATLEQRASTHWQKQYRDFSVDPGASFALDQPTRWWALRGEAEVEVSGRLLVGCLDTLVHLAGTRYGDVPALVRATHEGTILCLENCELTPVALLRALRQLRYAGWFDGLAALCFGRSSGPDGEGDSALTYREAVFDSVGDLKCPVLMDLDFGHKPPHLTLVQGALATVRLDAGESGAGGGVVTQTLA